MKLRESSVRQTLFLCVAFKSKTVPCSLSLFSSYPITAFLMWSLTNHPQAVKLLKCYLSTLTWLFICGGLFFSLCATTGHLQSWTRDLFGRVWTQQSYSGENQSSHTKTPLKTWSWCTYQWTLVQSICGMNAVWHWSDPSAVRIVYCLSKPTTCVLCMTWKNTLFTRSFLEVLIWTK